MDSREISGERNVKKSKKYLLIKEFIVPLQSRNENGTNKFLFSSVG